MLIYVLCKVFEALWGSVKSGAAVLIIISVLYIPSVDQFAVRR